MLSTFPSVSQTFVLNQITGLLDRGHEIFLYPVRQDDCSTVHTDVEKYSLLSRVSYRGESHLGIPRNRMVRLLKAVSMLTQDASHKIVPLLKSLNVIRFGRKAWSLSLLYNTNFFLEKRAYEYDIVHCHFGPTGVLGARLKEVGAINGKLLTTFYGYDISRYVKNHGPGVYDLLFKRNDMILCLSERMKNQLVQLGCNEQKVRVHRLGVDLTRYAFSHGQPRTHRKVQLLTIARLVKKKGVEYGIQAAAKVLQNHPGVEYRIVGDGPLKSDLESLISKLGMRGKVRLLGWKQQEEIVELLSNTDILLTPSVTAEDGDQEGTPTVLLEALAQGVPVVSTRHSGIPEVVQDGVSGFLVPERDIGALAERLAHLIEHREIWANMGRAGRHHVETYHDINKLNDQLVQYYQQSLNGNLL